MQKTEIQSTLEKIRTENKQTNKQKQSKSGINKNQMVKLQERKGKSLSRVRLFATLWTLAYQASQSMGFSRQEYWSGLLFASPGDFPNPGIEPGSPALQADTLPTEPPGKPKLQRQVKYISNNSKSTVHSLKWDSSKHFSPLLTDICNQKKLIK